MHNEAPAWVSFIPLLVVMGLFIYQAARILRRVGWSPWWSLSMLFPGAIFLWLWIMAFIRWPAFEPKYYEGVFEDAPDPAKPADTRFLDR